MHRESFIAFFSILFLASTSLAAQNFKIAVVDFKEFMDRSAVGEAIQKEIQDKGEQLKSDLENRQSELKALQDRYKREAPLWSPEQKAEEERAFRLKINDYNSIKTEKEKEFTEFRGQKINEAKARILELAEKEAKEKGYYLIIEKQSGTILYVHGSINITDAIIRQVDKSSGNQGK